MSNTIRTLGIASALAITFATGGCVAGVGLHGSASAEVETPTLVHVQPGVWVVENHHEPVFFHNDNYWAYRSGVWYRSRVHTGGWVRVHAAPHGVRRIHRPHRYVRYRAPKHVRTRRAPVRHVRDHRSKKHHKSRPPAKRDHRKKSKYRDQRKKKKKKSGKKTKVRVRDHR